MAERSLTIRPVSCIVSRARSAFETNAARQCRHFSCRRRWLMDHRIRLAVFSATLALPGIASPQAMTGPAKVLSVGREIVKPGKSTLHAKWETAWARALEAAKYSDHFI